MLLLEGLALVPLLFWLALTLDRRRAWPHELRLPRGDQTPSAHSVVAIVPARNEASVLSKALPTLLRQDIEGFRVVLVDDGSTDQTAELAVVLAGKARLAERLEVVKVSKVPPGWSGKVHALDRGLRAIEEVSDPAPEWLLLTDADIAHRPGSVAALIRRAVGEADGDRYDLVSVMAQLSVKSFWERLLIPPFVFFFQLLYPFGRIRDPRSSVAACAGGCVLVRRAALQTGGGFAAFKDAVIDDVALGRTIKKAGGHLWLGLDRGIQSVREYQTLTEIWNMVARTAFVQLRHSNLLLLLVMIGLAVFFVGPVVVVAVALINSAWSAALIASAAWLLESINLRPSVRHHQVPDRFAFTLPVAASLYGAMTLSSAWRHWYGSGAKWKGRSYGLRTNGTED